MIETMEIPKSLQMTFRRLLNRIPQEMRQDEEVQQKLLLYLKTGGEKLGRLYLAACQQSFPEDIRFVKAKSVEPDADTEGNDTEDNDTEEDSVEEDHDEMEKAE